MWFVVAFALFVVVDARLGGGLQIEVYPEDEIVWEEICKQIARRM
jgi:hypothetical protein